MLCEISHNLRVSTEEQAENPEGSIKNQEERLIQTIKFKNMEGNFGEVVHVYIDRAKSGKDTNRPELQKMLIAIKTKKINLVMVSELSRISRNMKDFSEIWDMMKRMDCGFYSLRENFDTTTAAGEMVLYTLANLAQFERRQVSERVAANMNARSARGLYNGGPVPIGYRLIPDKAGFLEIDPEGSKIVQKVFDAFVVNGTLSETARWLNANNFRLPRKMEGGGNQKRLEFFTGDNVHHILRNKFYIGVRDFRQNGETKETKTVWEPIVDRDVFERVGEMLTKNHSAKKPMTKSRYPYLLSGIVHCAHCKSHMVGKSAHGRGGKVPYYEHGWATIKNSVLTQKIFQCDPHRVPARKLEPLIIEKVKMLLSSESFLKELVQEANTEFEKNSPRKELERIKASIRGLNSQLEALAERLSELPKSVSPQPIFQQMEKIQKLKASTEQQLHEYQRSTPSLDRPAALNDFKEFVRIIRSLFEQTDNQDIQCAIIKCLIAKVEVGQTFVRIHYRVGESTTHKDVGFIKEDLVSKVPHLLNSSLNSASDKCSNSLTNGGPTRN